MGVIQYLLEKRDMCHCIRLHLIGHQLHHASKLHIIWCICVNRFKETASH